MITLDNLPLGQSATIEGFAPSAAKKRLMEMGFIAGRTVSAVRTAPLGDPVEFAVMESRVCMRRVDAATVLVQSQS
jgi:Fe2+ transport system protein FeoA